MEMKLLRNPDRITASRMTNGEKAITVILATPAGAAGVIGGRALVTHLVKKEVENAGGKVGNH
jgi:C4-type Zn-finger protein